MLHLSNIIKVLLKRYPDEKTTDQSVDLNHDQLFALFNRFFLSALSGNPDEINKLSEEFEESSEFKPVIRFYMDGLNLIRHELEKKVEDDPEFLGKLAEVSEWYSSNKAEGDLSDLAEQTWKVFFPEASGIYDNPEKSISDLREKRFVKITKLNDDPVESPVDEMIFTSNALLTIPAISMNIKDAGFSSKVESVLSQTVKDKQLYWYDHPIQIGVEPQKNEVLYGLRALNEAVSYEKKNRNAPKDKKLTCILSASVTHERLHQIAKNYLEDEFHRNEALENLEIYLFTETETDSLISEVLVPAAKKYLNKEPEEAKQLLQIFGVDGEYGRHYSFLKAITAFWKVFIDPAKKATFKIDLDQVFPQEILVNQSGSSAFEHLCTPLWGAEGFDSQDEPVDLGMIAGALVNEKDIKKSLFTPDITLPEKVETADELIFFSKLPQAISTQSEMLARYDSIPLDGKNICIQRVHVTGGTNGIIINRLFRYRPFTPSFFGRAEDQAYIMSILDRDDTDLAYVHRPGLIMRHDKEAFAQEAIKAAKIGKLVGDYTRILLFSAYSELLNTENFRIKNWLDPFTGCFISKIPISVVYLRFALKVMSFFKNDRGDEGVEFIKNGSRRITETLKFISSDFEAQYQKERAGWELYYDILISCQSALSRGDTYAKGLKERAEKLVQTSHLNI